MKNNIYFLLIIFCLLQFSCANKKYITWDDYNTLNQNTSRFTGIDSNMLRSMNIKLKRDVIDFGADNTGVKNSVTAFRNARDYARRYRESIYIPNGVYNLDDSIQIPGNVKVIGEDKEHTIVYNNSFVKDRPTFVITNKGKVAYGNEIANIYFITGVNTNEHIAIEIVDASGFNIHDCKIMAEPYFTGTGIKIKGRECGTIDNMMIYANRPIVIANNPNSSIDADHFNFRNLYLGASGNTVISIEEDVFLLNISFAGFQAWVGGTYGLYWEDTKSQMASTNLKIENVRWEQEQDKNGYLIYINHNYSLQNLILNNVYGGLNANGFYLNKVMKVSINESQYIGHSDKIGINSKALAGYSLTINNSNIQGKRILTDYRLNAIENYSNSDYSYVKDQPVLNYPILSFTKVNSSAAQPNSIFLDEEDGKLKFKDSGGTIYIVTLQK